jgi:hypothetical protein
MPKTSERSPFERLACLGGDGLRSELLDGEPAPAGAPPLDEGELESRLAPDGMLGGLSTPEACDAYAAPPPG